jgi:hypothetical protein
MNQIYYYNEFFLLELTYNILKVLEFNVDWRPFLQTLTNFILLIEYSMFIIYGQINVIFVTFLMICYN